VENGDGGGGEGGGGGKEERGRSNMQHREEGCHIYVFDLETFLLKYVFNVFYVFLCFFSVLLFFECFPCFLVFSMFLCFSLIYFLAVFHVFWPKPQRLSTRHSETHLTWTPPWGGSRGAHGGGPWAV
jgi:hypothetical protein